MLVLFTKEPIKCFSNNNLILFKIIYIYIYIKLIILYNTNSLYIYIFFFFFEKRKSIYIYIYILAVISKRYETVCQNKLVQKYFIPIDKLKQASKRY